MMDEDACDARIPVTVLTGFLGAGKTTLLGEILRDPRYADTAVIVNEFGDIALDHELVDSADENLIETTAGCLCCTVQGDVRRTVLSLIRRARAGEIRDFARLVIETTGLADPAPVLQTFIADPSMQDAVALNGVATVLDAVNGAGTLARFEEARRQVACADIVIVTKADQLPPETAASAMADLRERVRALNATTRVIDRSEAPLSAETLFSLAAYDPSGKAPDVLAWLRYEAEHAHDHAHGPAHGHAQAHDHPHSHDPAHHHAPDGARGQDHGQDQSHDHSHDANRHGDGIRAHCIALDRPLQANGFWFAFDMLRSYHGERLLRLKGLVALDDAPDEPILLHAVQHVVSPPRRLPSWPSADRRTRLVVIAEDIPEGEIQSVFALFEPAAADGRLGGPLDGLSDGPSAGLADSR